MDRDCNKAAHDVIAAAQLWFSRTLRDGLSPLST
jgi:hypothetical protein